MLVHVLLVPLHNIGILLIIFVLLVLLQDKWQIVQHVQMLQHVQVVELDINFKMDHVLHVQVTLELVVVVIIIMFVQVVQLIIQCYQIIHVHNVQAIVVQDVLITLELTMLHIKQFVVNVMIHIIWMIIYNVLLVNKVEIKH